MTLKPGFIPRLPAKRFDGVGSVDVFIPIVGITVSFETFPTTDYSWAGRLMGGPGKLNWPVAYSPGMIATWQGLTMGSVEGYLDAVPAGYFGKSGAVLRRPRAVVWHAGDHLPAEEEPIRNAILAALANKRAAMEAAGVYAAEGVRFDLGFGHGMMNVRWPYSSVVLLEDSTSTVFGTAFGFQPVYEPEGWVAGEVLYVSVGYATGTETPWAGASTGGGGTVEPLEEFRASERELWHSVIDRHASVNHHNVYVQEPIGAITTPDPAFDALRIQSVQDFFGTLNNATLDVIEGTVTDVTAQITASVEAAIAAFFGV